MAARGARQDSPSLQATNFSSSRDGQRSGVLIMGARRGDVFVATQVLISADTLGDEAAIRAWLAQHDIHVAPLCRSTASTLKDSAEGIGS